MEIGTEEAGLDKQASDNDVQPRIRRVLESGFPKTAGDEPPQEKFSSEG